MARVTVIQVVYNSRRFMEPVFAAIFGQRYRDMRVVAVISGNSDGGREYLKARFPQVEIIDPGSNVGFARGHNLVFEHSDSELFQLVNPDLIMDPDYVERLVATFDANPKLGAATGKLLRYDFDRGEKTDVIDSTGVTIARSGRARDRGQHERDRGQYDSLTELAAVSGAGSMVRRAALEAVKVPKAGGGFEYFDEDFHSYWEDVDLFWRMSNAGWENRYVPGAVAYHGRGAGSSVGGYRDVIGFIRHHRQLPSRVRRLNYKNHIFLYLKNSPWFYPQFFIRELAMLAYVLLFEISTLKVVPELFSQLPGMWRKRRYIREYLTR